MIGDNWSAISQPPADLRDIEWMARGACHGADLDSFFPTSGPQGRLTRIAKQVCLSCPVRTQCLHWAVQTHQRGIWGGTSDRERRDMRRGQRVQETS